MSAALTSSVFKAAGLTDRWTLASLAPLEATEHDDPKAALAAFHEGFEPEITLATCRSGVALLKGDDAPPHELGDPLHLEGVLQLETRILRHLGGRRWRCVRLREGQGDPVIAESVRWLGGGAVGEGSLAALRYRRYWRVEADGALRPVAARLAGVETA